MKILLSGLWGLGLLLSGCALPGALQPGAPASANKAEQPAASATTLTESAPGESPAAISPTPAETLPVASEAAPTEIAISHQSRPGNPLYSQALPGECNTGFNYKIGFRVRPPCDTWGTNMLERAVSADMSSFYHYIDILSARVGKSGDWFYASFDLFGAGMAEEGVPLTYFFELDLDQNGRGDILLAVQDLDLYISEWSVTGVRAWRDLNGDVGGPTAVRPDGQSGDGYETLVFDQGLGDDPDLAWVRHNPDNYQRIEFAFKPALLDRKESFMLWAGAMRGRFDPQAFDLVDSQSETALYEVDTTCGWVFGHEKGYNLKKCFVAPDPTKAPQEESGPAICIKPPHPNPQDGGWVWNEAKCKWELWN
ncbi:MAG: hypothetical protein RBS68_02075 [Anaerolineales bacterium]|nr:hypothetical protein [Anaerolineales bacterium]